MAAAYLWLSHTTSNYLATFIILYYIRIIRLVLRTDRNRSDRTLYDISRLERQR